MTKTFTWWMNINYLLFWNYNLTCLFNILINRMVFSWWTWTSIADSCLSWCWLLQLQDILWIWYSSLVIKLTLMLSLNWVLWTNHITPTLVLSIINICRFLSVRKRTYKIKCLPFLIIDLLCVRMTLLRCISPRYYVTTRLKQWQIRLLDNRFRTVLLIPQHHWVSKEFIVLRLLLL